MKRFVESGTVLFGILALGLAAGCGDGGTVGAVGDPPGGGIGGTGSVAVVAEGPITAFGSVVVNGIEFELGPGAKVVVGGLETSEADLQLGMVVRVEGAYDPGAPPTPLGYTPGRAERVEYASEVKGPAEVDAQGNVSVLGRRIGFSPDTRFEGLTGASGIRAGDVLEVSGLVEPDGGILATYVELVCRAGGCSGQEVELRGPVSNPDPVAGTFEILGQGIRYGGDVGALHEGTEVRVKGRIGGDGLVEAEHVDPVHRTFPEGRRAELEGVVGWVDAEGQRFGMHGVEVDASRARFESGTWADLAPGVRVEVEGSVEEGVLRAWEIEIKGRHHRGEGGHHTGAEAGGAEDD